MVNVDKPAGFSDPKHAVKMAFDQVIKKRIAVKRSK